MLRLGAPHTDVATRDLVQEGAGGIEGDLLAADWSESPAGLACSSYFGPLKRLKSILRPSTPLKTTAIRLSAFLPLQEVEVVGFFPTVFDLSHGHVKGEHLQTNTQLLEQPI